MLGDSNRFALNLKQGAVTSQTIAQASAPSSLLCVLSATKGKVFGSIPSHKMLLARALVVSEMKTNEGEKFSVIIDCRDGL